MIIFNRQCCSLSFQRECAFPIVTFYFLFRVWIISCRLTAPCVFSQYAGAYQAAAALLILSNGFCGVKVFFFMI